MSESFHDPSEFIRGVQQILVSDKKRIGFLFGAGTSLAQKNEIAPTVPSVSLMTSQICDELCDTSTEKANGTKTPDSIDSIYKKVLDEIKSEISEAKFNVEMILSNLEQKHIVIGNGTLNGLNKAGLEDLIAKFKGKIKDKVSVHKFVKNGMKQHLIQADFADWIGHASRKCPVEIFTTNYDFLFEIGLEHHNIPYYCGFSGSYEPFFAPETVADLSFLPSETKLWKVHGSLGWKNDKDTGRVIRTNPSDEDILIYPSILKYNDSQKQPYISLMDRLSSFLRQDDCILFTCGYSFNDEHINERIMSALSTNTTSHVIAMVFDKYIGSDKLQNFSLREDTQITRLAKSNEKLSAYGFRDAIIGRKLRKWRLRKEPERNATPILNLYFDEDAPMPGDQSIGEVKPENIAWTGHGEFILPDFVKFVQFLNAMIIQDEVSILGQGLT